MASSPNLERAINPPRQRAQPEIDLPLADVHNISKHFEEIFSEAPIFIGGRGVNLHCLQSSRPTHDVDLVLQYKPTIKQLEDLPQIPTDKISYYFSKGHESPSRDKIYYYSPAVAGLVKGGRIG